MAKLSRSQQRQREHIKLQISLAMQALRAAQQHMGGAMVAVDRPGGDIATYAALLSGARNTRKALRALVRVSRDDPFVTAKELADADVPHS